MRALHAAPIRRGGAAGRNGAFVPGMAVAAAMAALCAAAPTAHAQDAQRGAALYRALPGSPGVGSCLSCHGEPINNRNSVLRGAAGGPLISRTIAAVGAMGFLRQFLGEPDLADIAAYLATVVPGGPLENLPDPWPTVDDFGAQAVGTLAAERTVWVRNLQPRADIAIGTVVSSEPGLFAVQHECPLSLPPLGQCRIRTWFQPRAAGPAEARVDIVGTAGEVLRSVRLLGTGVAVQAPQLAWLRVDDSGSPIPPPPTLIDFGRVEVGASASGRLRLRNPSMQAVPFRRLRITGPQALRFSLAAPCVTAGRLEPMADCEVVITHAPRGPERSEGWVELDADAAHPPLLRVQGFGVAAAQDEEAATPPPPDSSGGGAASWRWLIALAAAVLALRRLPRA